MAEADALPLSFLRGTAPVGSETPPHGLGDNSVPTSSGSEHLRTFQNALHTCRLPFSEAPSSSSPWTTPGSQSPHLLDQERVFSSPCPGSQQRRHRHRRRMPQDIPIAGGLTGCLSPPRPPQSILDKHYSRKHSGNPKTPPAGSSPAKGVAFQRSCRYQIPPVPKRALLSRAQAVFFYFRSRIHSMILEVGSNSFALSGQSPQSAIGCSAVLTPRLPCNPQRHASVRVQWPSRRAPAPNRAVQVR